MFRVPQLKSPANTSASDRASSVEPQAPRHGFLRRCDDWLSPHVDLIALTVVAAGFVLRLMSAAGGYLDPDEALHYLLSHQASLAAVYEASLSNAHPPLFFMLLYFWQLLGNSEFTLRLLSVLSGTACLWVSFRWIGYTLGKVEGLIALLLLAFCPTFISLSSEVRGYAFLLLTMAGALYFLERALRERSQRMVLLSWLALYAANLVHYSALWFTLAVGLYALVRILRERMPARLTGLWLGLQAGMVGLWALLYFTHIRTLQGSGMERFAREGWLWGSYFHAGQDRLLPFLVRTVDHLFVFLFASRVAGFVAFALFAVGVLWLLVARRPPLAVDVSPSTSRSGANQNGNLVAPHSPPATAAGLPPNSAPRGFMFFLLAPFTVNFLAAAAGVYPFGGSRHNVFLLLVAVAGISYGLGRLAGRRLSLALLATVIIASDWNPWSNTGLLEHYAPDWSRAHMTAAVGYIHEEIPAGSLLFVDYQTSNMLGYYLGRSQMTTQFQYPAPGSKFVEFPYGGYRVVAAPFYNFYPQNFWSALRNVKQQHGLDAAATVWVVDAGWTGGRLNRHIAELHPSYACPRLRTFGRGISVFQVREAAD